MKKKFLTRLLGGGALCLLPLPAAAAITCTAAPDCTSLGYTKTASQCPSGGVKCPFDSNKMFCFKNTASYNFQIQTPTAQYHVVYHDGSTASSYSYSANKTPIGIVYWLHPSSGGKSGLIASLEQPITGTWAEAIEYCKNYVVKGTNVGDWRMPDLAETLLLGRRNQLGTAINGLDNFNSKALLIRRGDQLSWSFTMNYRNRDSADYTDSISGLDSYSRINNSEYWTSNDYYSNGTSNGYYVDLSSWDFVNGMSKGTKRHFRCIMDF